MDTERVNIQVLQTNKWIDFESCDLSDVPYRMINIQNYYLGKNGWSAARAVTESGNLVQYETADWVRL